MNHYQTRATAGSNGVLKNYMLAVLVGILLGGAYAVTASPVEVGERTSPSTQPLANQLRVAKAIHAANEGATSIVDRGIAAETVQSWSI
jgi:hypothetical protein